VACVTCGGKERCIQSFSGETPRKNDHLEDLDVDGIIMLMRVWKGVDCIDPSEVQICGRLSRTWL
jgi:hypothetical protein